MSREARAHAVGRSRLLNVATIGWNTVEGVVAVAAGVAAGSVILVGFGIDSGVEVSAALILAWRLHQERRGGGMQEADARATKAIALSFAALAVDVAVHAVGDLTKGTEPAASAVGVAPAALSLLLMPLLTRAKARLAPSSAPVPPWPTPPRPTSAPSSRPSSSPASAPTGCSAGGGPTPSPVWASP